MASTQARVTSVAWMAARTLSTFAATVAVAAAAISAAAAALSAATDALSTEAVALSADAAALSGQATGLHEAFPWCHLCKKGVQEWGSGFLDSGVADTRADEPAKLKVEDLNRPMIIHHKLFLQNQCVDVVDIFY